MNNNHRNLDQRAMTLARLLKEQAIHKSVTKLQEQVDAKRKRSK